MIRVVAAILIDRGNVVQTRQFKTTNIVGNVTTAAKFFNKWDVDEIIALNISREPWGGMFEAVEEIGRQVHLPLTVGGKIKTIEECDSFFRRGADKIAIGQFANEKLIRQIALGYGSQAITQIINGPGERLYEDIGEVLYNCRERDGMKNGFDLEMIRTLSKAFPGPVIAMGGAGTPQHFVEAVQAGADAVAAGNIFHYYEHAPVKAKKALARHGIEVRHAVL
jgi:cyclase